jgi:hypothetical protein
VDVGGKCFFRGSVHSRQAKSQLLRQRETASVEISHPLKINLSQRQETVKRAVYYKEALTQASFS